MASLDVNRKLKGYIYHHSNNTIVCVGINMQVQPHKSYPGELCAVAHKRSFTLAHQPKVGVLLVCVLIQRYKPRQERQLSSWLRNSQPNKIVTLLTSTQNCLLCILYFVLVLWYCLVLFVPLIVVSHQSSSSANTQQSRRGPG